MTTLRLYVAGATPASRRAVRNLARASGGRHAFEVVDLYQRPELGAGIEVAPTLVRPDGRRVVGDLSTLSLDD